MSLRALRTDYRGDGLYKPIAEGLNAVGRVVNSMVGMNGIDVDYVAQEIRISGSRTRCRPPMACASMSLLSPSGSVTTTGVVDFGVLNHETCPNILDADLAANTITVKQGYSGVYAVKLQLWSSWISSPAGAQVAVRQGGANTECFWSASPGDSDFAFSASIDLYINASAADVVFDAYCSFINNTTIDYCRFDMHLLELKLP